MNAKLVLNRLIYVAKMRITLTKMKEVRLLLEVKTLYFFCNKIYFVDSKGKFKVFLLRLY